jgi:hypothetical protein
MGSSCSVGCTTAVDRIGASLSTHSDTSTSQRINCKAARRYAITKVGRLGSHGTGSTTRSLGSPSSRSTTNRAGGIVTVHSLPSIAEDAPLSQWSVKDEQGRVKNESGMSVLLTAMEPSEDLEFDRSFISRTKAHGGRQALLVRQQLMKVWVQRIGLFPYQPRANGCDHQYFQDDNDAMHYFLQKLVDLAFQGVKAYLRFSEEVVLSVQIYEIILYTVGARVAKRARRLTSVGSTRRVTVVCVSRRDRETAFRLYCLMKEKFAFALDQQW